MSNLFKEFEKIDEFRNEFKSEFNIELKYIINKHFIGFQDSPTLTEILNEYATHIINATESVIDKDKHYPEYRIREELDKMIVLANKAIEIEYNLTFNDDLNQKAKALMVDHFKKIFDLSSHGFRLLEANAKVHNRHFIYMFYELQNK